LPKNKRKAFALTADFVAMLHSEVVPVYLPGGTRLQPARPRDRGLLESACARPFQTAFQQDVHATVLEKAAVLFHGLIANHPFHDGNKRTAVVALDAFLAANDYLLGLLPTDMYILAIQTAGARANNVTVADILKKILEMLTEWAVPFNVLAGDPEFAEIYKRRIELRKAIRQHTLNHT
jgi:death-on-curing family protein